MSNYYFLATYLPTLSLDKKAEITFEEFNMLLRANLTKADYAKALAFQRYYDIENIHNYWTKEPFNIYGTMDENEIEDALITGIGFPDYVYAFMDKYERLEDRLKYFHELSVAYSQSELAHLKGFVEKLLRFQREWRLVMVGFRAKKLHKDLAKELQFEDPEDPIIQQILAQKDAKVYEPPEDYEELKPIFSQYQDAPLALHRALSVYRLAKIDQMVEFEQFSIDYILAYMVRLFIIENWQHLNRERGTEIVNTIIEEAK
jgi:Protein of unknown function (DUF2764)